MRVAISKDALALLGSSPYCRPEATAQTPRCRNATSTKQSNSMKKNVFDPLFQPFLIIILAVSGLLVASTSVLTPTGLYPDERAHFGYAYGIYQQKIDPFFDRTKIFTDGTEYNHLRHPPAYYFLAAGAMAILKLDKDLANSTLSSSKYHRQVTRTLIPPLRITSLALYLVHIFAGPI